jgi:hypothetical protein
MQDTPSSTALREAAVDYAVAQRAAVAFSKQTGALLDALYAEHAQLFEAAANAKEVAKGREIMLRDAVIDAYEATGDKHPGFGAGVRVGERLEYAKERALAWAEKAAPLFIMRTLDAKPFEAYVKGVHQDAEKGSERAAQLWAELSPWMEVAAVPTATLPADVEAALLAEGVTLPWPEIPVLQPIPGEVRRIVLDTYDDPAGVTRDAVTGERVQS